MAFEPSDKSAGNIGAGDGRKVPEPSTSPLARPHAGFAEQGALFRTVPDLPAELRALQGYADPAMLRFAAVRAEQLGVGADLIVARSGTVGSDTMLEAYAADLGVEIDRLDDIAADVEFDPAEVLSRGVLPAQTRKGQICPTVALAGGNAGKLYEWVARSGESAGQFRITSEERLRAFVERAAAAALARQAAFGLREASPVFSAATTYFAHSRAVLLTALLAAATALYLWPGPARLVLEVILAAIFLSWASLRAYACLLPEETAQHNTAGERDLPFYTVLIPLYREASVVPDLVRAISALNYPREKLDVKLILEPDDTDTIAAVQAIQLDPCFEIIHASLLGPRTKPKALRAAMPFVRGEYLVIYDAEDRPHPDQLRDAYAQFLSGDRRLACVQAKLAIDNADPAFLADHFRAEYSGLFDVLLPALARLRLPLPLGGTSNHFRTSALREAGAWDPHNVTEDADLGVRLARFGYATGVVDSTTREEAPARLGAWLPQRTRWMKGWLQTYIVHMRDPLLLLRQLGWRGFVAFQLLIGGSVLAALVHPIFAALLIADIWIGSLVFPAGSFAQSVQQSLVLATLASGYIASGSLAYIGMRRRGTPPTAWVLFTIPVYWLLLSAAAWRAVWKLITAPHQWEKTAHGDVKRKHET